MQDSDKNKGSDTIRWKEKDKDYLIAHYHEVGEASRLYDRLIWEVPSIAIAIVGGLITAAYVREQPPVVRTLLTGIAAMWAFGVIVFAVKHQFFVRIQKKRLAVLEHEAFEIPRLQRSGDTKEYEELGIMEPYPKDPEGLERLGAHRTLNVILWVMFLCAAGLTTYNLISLF